MRYAIFVVGLLMLATASLAQQLTSCGNVVVNGRTVNLFDIPNTFFQFPLIYDETHIEQDVWSFSLCNATNASAIYPIGKPCINEPSYVHIFDGDNSGTCDIGINDLQWIQVIENNSVEFGYGATTNASNPNQAFYTMTVTIQCGTSSVLAPVGPYFMMTGTWPNFNYGIVLYWDGVCSATTTMPPPATPTTDAPPPLPTTTMEPWPPTTTMAPGPVPPTTTWAPWPPTTTRTPGRDYVWSVTCNSTVSCDTREASCLSTGVPVDQCLTDPATGLQVMLSCEKGHQHGAKCLRIESFGDSACTQPVGEDWAECDSCDASGAIRWTCDVTKRRITGWTQCNSTCHNCSEAGVFVVDRCVSNPFGNSYARASWYDCPNTMVRTRYFPTAVPGLCVGPSYDTMLANGVCVTLNSVVSRSLTCV